MTFFLWLHEDGTKSENWGWRDSVRVCNCISCAEHFCWSSSWNSDPISVPICMRGFVDVASPCPHLFICFIFVCICFIQNNSTFNVSVIFANIRVVMLSWKNFPLNIFLSLYFKFKYIFLLHLHSIQPWFEFMLIFLLLENKRLILVVKYFL